MIPENIKGHSSGEVAVVQPSTFNFENALACDGISNIVEFTPYPNDLQPTGYTTANWIKMTSSTSYQTVWGSESSAGFLMLHNGNVARWKINGTLMEFNFADTILLDEWFFIVARWDGNTARVYVNNVESTTGGISFSGGTSSTRHPSSFCKDMAGKSLTGRVDEAAMWISPLSFGDITDAYNNGAGADLSTISAGYLWYHFNFNQEGTQSTALDSSGNGNHGTLNNFNFNAVTPWVDGLLGNALEFDGINNSVRYSLNGSTYTTWGFSIWIKASDLSTVSKVIIGAASSNYYVTVNGPNNRVDLRQVDSTTISWSGFTFTNDTWCHIVISCTSDMVRVYVNNIESSDGAQAFTSSPNSIYNHRLIGKRSTGSNAKMTVDTFGYWYDYAPSPTDVSTLYNGGIGASVFGISDINLYVAFDFDGNFNDYAVTELSGNSADGIMENFNLPRPDTTPWVAHTQGESALVEGRMTTPSVPFVNALDEYVKSEQGALNDNWNLTDDIIAFNIDSEINSLIAWKAASGSKLGTIADLSWETYKGYIWNSNLTAKRIELDASPSIDAKKYAINDAFTSVKLGEITDAGTVRYYLALGGNTTAERTYHYINSLSDRLFNSINGVSVAGADSPESYSENRMNMIMIQNATETNVYKDNLLIGNNIAAATELRSGYWRLGVQESLNASWGYHGVMEGFAYGGGVGFDSVSHNNVMQKFADRMLIQKHIAEVNAVLARYTDLTDREVFAIGRLVARSVENGNWDLVKSVGILNTYLEANHTISLKGTNSYSSGGTAIPHISGKGILVDTVGQKMTNEYTLPVVTNHNLGALCELLPATGITRYIITDATRDLTYINTIDQLVTRIGGTSFPNTVPFPNNLNCCVLRNSVSGEMWINGTQIYSSGGGLAQSNGGTTIGNVGSGAAPIMGYVKAWYGGEAEGIKMGEWQVDLSQAINEIEIGKVETFDWDITSETYDWSDRSLLPYQLEELVTKINANCDSVTTGRTLNLVGHLGITLQAQAQIDDLENNKGWTVTLI